MRIFSHRDETFFSLWWEKILSIVEYVGTLFSMLKNILGKFIFLC